MNTELLSKLKKYRDNSILEQKALLRHYRYDQKIDLRITSLRKLTRLYLALQTAFLLAQNQEEKSETEIWDEIKSDVIPELDNVEPKQHISNHYNFLKTSFVSGLHSIFESVVRAYSIELDAEWHKNKDGNWGIRSIRDLFSRFFNEVLEMQSKELIDAKPTFDMLNNLRNSLHNNGVYLSVADRNANIDKVSYKGVDYEFVPTKRIDFVTWDLVLDLGDDVRSIFFHLSKHEKIKSIPGILLDPSEHSISLFSN